MIVLVKKNLVTYCAFFGGGGGVTLVQKVVYRNVYLSTGIQAILLLYRVISNLFAKHFYFRSE